MNNILQQKIKDYVLSMANLTGVGSFDAFVNSLGFDKALKMQCNYNGAPSQFVGIFINLLEGYGTLQDGRNPIEEVIKGVMRNVGKDKQEYGRQLLQEYSNSDYIVPESEQVSVESDIQSLVSIDSVSATLHITFKGSLSERKIRTIVSQLEKASYNVESVEYTQKLK